MKKQLALCVAVSLLLAGLLFAGGLVKAEPQRSSQTLTIIDSDGSKVELTVEDMRKMPQEMEKECISVGKSSGFIGIYDYTGVRLSALLEKAKATMEAKEYKQENSYIIFKGTDGYQTIASWTELMQNEGCRALVALDKDLEPLPPFEGKFRLILPGDKYVGRSVKCLETIEIRCAEGFVDLKKSEGEKKP